MIWHAANLTPPVDASARIAFSAIFGTILSVAEISCDRGDRPMVHSSLRRNCAAFRAVIQFAQYPISRLKLNRLQRCRDGAMGNPGKDLEIFATYSRASLIELAAFCNNAITTSSRSSDIRSASPINVRLPITERPVAKMGAEIPSMPVFNSPFVRL